MSSDQTPSPPAPKKRTNTSTLAPGSHRYPTFYACYLLRSYHHGKMNQRTYVGSTPDPPRRIRQHNGEIKGGAVRTKYYRPWEMEVICYGFPSKLVALQFEWVWNAPYKSRHLQIERVPTEVCDQTNLGSEGAISTKSTSIPKTKIPIFPRNLGSRLEIKLKVLQKMMTIKPWSEYPLKVLFFDEAAYKLWFKLRSNDSQLSEKTGSQKKKIPGVDSREASLHVPIEVAFRPEGVDGLRKQRRGLPTTPHDSTKPIDVKDGEATLEDYEQMEDIRNRCGTQGVLRCSLCPHDIHIEDYLAYAVCSSSTCLSTSHLLCLSQHYLSLDIEGSMNITPDDEAYTFRRLLPDRGSCPTCYTTVRWGELIQSCYRRMAANRRAAGIEDPDSETDSEQDSLGTPHVPRKYINTYDTQSEDEEPESTPAPPHATTTPKQSLNKSNKYMKEQAPRSPSALRPKPSIQSSAFREVAKARRKGIPRLVQCSSDEFSDQRCERVTKDLPANRRLLNKRTPKRRALRPVGYMDEDEDEPEEDILALMDDLDVSDSSR